MIFDQMIYSNIYNAKIDVFETYVVRSAANRYFLVFHWLFMCPGFPRQKIALSIYIYAYYTAVGSLAWHDHLKVRILHNANLSSMP